MDHTDFEETTAPTIVHISDPDQYTPFNSNDIPIRRTEPSTAPVKEIYRPCTEDSCYHDLRCGHRVRSPYPEPCGDNCDNNTNGPSYLCPQCIECDVRISCQLDSISLITSMQSNDADERMEDARPTRQQSANLAAEKIVKNMLEEGNYRRCRVVPKMTSPKMQMFERIAEDNGLSLLQTEPEKPRKRPGRGARIPPKKPELNNSRGLEQETVQKAESSSHRHAPYKRPQTKNSTSLMETVENTASMEPVVAEEDEATRAVQKVLKKLTLTLPESQMSEKG